MLAYALCLSQSSLRALGFPTAGQESVVFLLRVLKPLKVYFSLEELYLIHFFVMQGGTILSCLCLFEVVFHLRRLSPPFFYLAAAALEKANVLSLTFTAEKSICGQGLFFF